MAYNSLQIQTVAAFIVTYVLATLFLGARYFQSIKINKTVDPDLDLTAFNKIAMLVVLYRINPSNGYRTLVVSLGAAIFAYTLTLTIITGGPCNPLHSGTTTCLENVALSHAVLNIVSDLAVVMTPIPTIRRLVTSTRQKVSVGCLLAVGSCVVICSIARLPYVVLIGITTDVTYTEAILGIWSIVEINLGIICGCAMRLKSLLTTYLPRLGLTGGSASNGLSGGRAGAKSYQNSSGKKSVGGIRPANDGPARPGDEVQFPDEIAGGGRYQLRPLPKKRGAGPVYEASTEDLQFYNMDGKSSVGSEK
ncbi:hypothetical protein Daus18300_001358 [Diaporthe australafricana]|uniref:Rhodopsin domain-containing protein n=1 Tax=Diaporthe australafricana TaxID=127596 RepID=A0ABR3XZ00_9PEZI